MLFDYKAVCYTLKLRHFGIIGGVGDACGHSFKVKTSGF